MARDKMLPQNRNVGCPVNKVYPEGYGMDGSTTHGRETLC